LNSAVSVVIPAHDYAHYLPVALRSILAQTWTAFEVVVVDDGSTDHTRAAVAQFTDPRIRYVWQENAGLSAARNTGIREARHDFLAFLDADDAWQPGFLGEVMEQFAGSGAAFDLIATASLRMDSDGRLLDSAKFSFDQDTELTARDFCLRNRPLCSSIIVRRAVFDTCGFFDTTLRSSEDRDLWIRATAAGHRFWFLNRPLALIRRHRGNMSSHAPRMKQNSRAVLLKAWRSQAVSRADVPFWLRVFSVHFFQIALTHFDGGYRIRAFAWLAASVIFWPIYLSPARVYEPRFFRLRTFATFCRRILTDS
jgi:glycosyltransferase involved in cell wall biosynthesis